MLLICACLTFVFLYESKSVSQKWKQSFKRGLIFKRFLLLMDPHPECDTVILLLLLGLSSLLPHIIQTPCQLLVQITWHLYVTMVPIHLRHPLFLFCPTFCVGYCEWNFPLVQNKSHSTIYNNVAWRIVDTFTQQLHDKILMPWTPIVSKQIWHVKIPFIFQCHL